MSITPQGCMNTPYPNAYVAWGRRDNHAYLPALTTWHAISQSLLNTWQGRVQRPFIQGIC
jgi:hypothetical protein